MPTIRTPLPWHEIFREIKRAIPLWSQEEYGKHVFTVNCQRLAEYIDTHSEEYPEITRGVTFKGLQGRLSMSMRKMGWDRWTAANRTGKGMKYIIPWKEMK